MAVLKCKMCGGDLNVVAGVSVCECEYCGTKQTVPTANNEKKLVLFARANRLRLECDFDKAAGVYEAIVADFSDEAEAYWGLVLCRYGIEYVDDPKTGKKIPTCHRSSFDSVLEDNNFQMALDYADPMAREVYREEARQIEQLRRGIIAVSSKEEPYDIFICYKENDAKGERTIDSVVAQDVYGALTEKGYRVFFSRISLEDKLGVEYEPYIFAALHSAKVMLAFGTDYEHFNAVWVKNEWSRFLQLIEKGEKKTLIPCYKDIDPYDMPKEFAKLQAQDMGKVGAMQDLLRGIEKILGADKTAVKETVVMGGNSQVTPLLKRAFMYLEDGDWAKADSFCEQVLNIDPECAEAYLGKLMAELRVHKREDLKNSTEPFAANHNWSRIMQFADDALREELQGYVETMAAGRIANIYKQAVDAMKAAQTEQQYQHAAQLFQSIATYKDAKALAKKCLSYATMAKLEKNKRKQTITKVAILAVGAIALVLLFVILRPAILYDTATSYFNQGAYESAKEKFVELGDYKDSAKMVKECDYRHGVSLMEGGSYALAIEYLSPLGRYRDADEILLEAKYNYAVENRSFPDEATYAYVLELKDIGYPGSDALYKEVYAWYVSIVVNHDSTSNAEEPETLSTDLPLYVHVAIYDGPPNGTVRLGYEVLYPSGEHDDITYFADEWSAGTGSYFAWEDGVDMSGEYTVFIYDDNGTIIGERTFYVS